MAFSKASRVAFWLFPVAVIASVAARAFGVVISWSNWLLLGGVGVSVASTIIQKRRPATSEILALIGIVLTIAAVIGMVAAR
jgi:hypothetical protein